MLGIFLDTETNGLNPYKHSILEIAFKIVDVVTGQLNHEYQAVITQSQNAWKKSDPQSLEVNGFTWEEIISGLPKEEVAGAIITALAKNKVQRGKAVFICQNPSFDHSFFSQLIDPDLQESLRWPYHWLDLASMYWALHVYKEPYPWSTGVSKDTISETYALANEAKPHRAMNGVNHLLECYKTMVGFPEDKKIRTQLKHKSFLQN